MLRKWQTKRLQLYKMQRDSIHLPNAWRRQWIAKEALVFTRFKSVTEKHYTQHWYCCKCGWTLKLRLFASLYFCSGRRISIWLFVVNFNFIFSNGQQFRAGRYKISHLQQYLSVVRHPKQHST